MKQKALFHLALALSISLSLAFTQLSGHAYAQGPVPGIPETAWNVLYDGGATDQTFGIVADTGGNVYVAGSSGEEGSLDFRTIKYDRNGAVLWNVTYDDGGNEYAAEITRDSVGNIYVSGNSAASGSDHMLLVKYNNAGVVQWTASYDSGATDVVFGAVPDESGNVYVAGVRYTGNSDSDRYLLKYDSAGTLLWSVTDARAGRDANGGFTRDSAGNLYITSFIDDTFRTTKYDSNGVVLWDQIYNPGVYDYSYTIVVDEAGNVYVGGYTGNNSTYLEVVTLKYDPSGNLLWDRRYNGGGFARPSGIAVDRFGNIYLSVSKRASVVGEWVSMDVIKYDSAGNLIWELPYDVAAGAYGGGVAVDASGGNVYLTGHIFNGTNDDFRTIRYSTMPQVVEFFDDFESYTIGSRLSDVYEYKGIMGWNSHDPAPEADRFQVGTIGSNQVFQYQWAGPSYHHPHVREFYLPKFSHVYEVGATYLYTQPSMGLEMLMFEWDGNDEANSIFLMANYTNNLVIYRNGNAIPLGQLALWPDTVITQMSHRIEAKRLSDTSLEASVIRLDTNERMSITVTIPYLESETGFSTGIAFYEDWSGGVYVNIDDFYVKGIPLSAELVATSTSSNLYPGDPVVVDLTIENAEELYAAQAVCTVDPDVIQPQEAAFGDFFDPVNRLVGINHPDAASGTWSGAISQRSPALPLSGDGLFATVTYEAQSAGTTSLSCEPLFADENGFTQLVSFTGMDVTVLPFAVASGVAQYQGRTDHSGITITATGPFTVSTTTDSAGNYALNLRTGEYDITASAPGYLTHLIANVSVTSGDTASLPDTVLRGGDANGDNTIDIGDATLVAANFSLTVPPADVRADINGDGIVNIQDLAILGSNYGLSGD